MEWSAHSIYRHSCLLDPDIGIGPLVCINSVWTLIWDFLLEHPSNSCPAMKVILGMCKTFLRCGIVPQSLFLGFWELQGKESHFSIDHFLWFQSVVPCKNMGMTTWVHCVDVATIIHIINMSYYQNKSHTSIYVLLYGWKLSRWQNMSPVLTLPECKIDVYHIFMPKCIYMMPLKGVFSSLGMWDAGKLYADPLQCALVHSVLHDV